MRLEDMATMEVTLVAMLLMSIYDEYTSFCLNALVLQLLFIALLTPTTATAAAATSSLFSSSLHVLIHSSCTLVLRCNVCAKMSILHADSSISA